MGETINLRGNAAIEKIRSIAKHETAMFCTFRSEPDTTPAERTPSNGDSANGSPSSHGQGDRFETRPMQTQAVDDEGTIWFLSDARSAKNAEVEAKSTVQLVYSIGGSSAYLCVRGSAFVTKNKEKIAEMWSPLAKAWFPDGKDDPNLTLIGVRPTEGRYWDSKHGKMIQMVGIVIGAVTGKPTDDGRVGKLRP